MLMHDSDVQLRGRSIFTRWPLTMKLQVSPAWATPMLVVIINAAIKSALRMGSLHKRTNKLRQT
jgi:hypothetical protein